MNCEIQPITQHPIHGGQLTAYAQHYNIPKQDWLDLSTGINPKGYPCPELPEYVLRDLPNDNDGLTQAAARYYGSGQVLMVPGSSWAIQNLPVILNKQKIKTVLLPAIGYSEHERAWRALDVNIIYYGNEPSTQQLMDCDVCVLINPNNPSTHLITQEKVQIIAQHLNSHAGVLIVDEAFMDSQPLSSMVQQRPDNVIVLRSLGKFFGLAGLRLGAVIANNRILAEFTELLPPWSLSHPARFIATQALQDSPWIKQTSLTLQQQSQKLVGLCEQSLQKQLNSEVKISSTDLFVSISFVNQQDALQCHHHLCLQGIYTRLLDDKSGIRLGLPNDTSENWQRLEDAFIKASAKINKGITNVYAS